MEDLVTVEQVKEIGQSWATAELRADVAALDSVLADNFVCVGPLGFVLDKAQYLQPRQSGDLKHEAFTWETLSIRMFGETAVVVGTLTQRTTYQGRDASGQLRVSQIVIRQAGRWRIAHLHLSRVVQPPATSA